MSTGWLIIQLFLAHIRLNYQVVRQLIWYLGAYQTQQKGITSGKVSLEGWIGKGTFLLQSQIPNRWVRWECAFILNKIGFLRSVSVHDLRYALPHIWLHIIWSIWHSNHIRFGSYGGVNIGGHTGSFLVLSDSSNGNGCRVFPMAIGFLGAYRTSTDKLGMLCRRHLHTHSGESSRKLWNQSDRERISSIAIAPNFGSDCSLQVYSIRSPNLGVFTTGSTADDVSFYSSDASP